MKIETVGIRNLYQFKGVEIDLPVTNSLVLVYGRRGVDTNDTIAVGKSNFFGSIYWGMTGEDIKGGRAEEVIRHGQTKAHVRLKLGKMSIVRSRGSTKVFECNGKPFNYSQGKVFLHKRVGISPEIWKNAVCYSQMDVNRFILLTTAEKKKFISYLFMLEVFEKAFLQAKIELREIDKRIERVSGSFDQLREELSKSKKELQKCINKKKVNIQAIKQEMQGINEKYVLYKKRTEKYAKRLGQYRQSLYAIATDRSKLQGILRQLTANASGICPLCGSKIDPKRIDEMKEKIRDLNCRVDLSEKCMYHAEKKYSRFESMSDECENALGVLDKKLYAEDQSQDKKLLVRQIRELRNNIQVCRARYSKKIKRKKAVETVSNIFHRDGFVSHYIAYIVDLMNKYLKENSYIYGGRFYPQIDPNSLDITTKSNDKVCSIESRSGGEQRLISIMLFLAFNSVYRFVHQGQDVLEFMILDEPVAQVDRKHIKMIFSLLGEFASRNKLTIYVITNDQWVIKKYNELPQIQVLDNGKYSTVNGIGY